LQNDKQSSIKQYFGTKESQCERYLTNTCNEDVKDMKNTTLGPPYFGAVCGRNTKCKRNHKTSDQGKLLCTTAEAVYIVTKKIASKERKM
jgi:hypothetical protein